MNFENRGKMVVEEKHWLGALDRVCPILEKVNYTKVSNY
jgi:hypothetical protein